MPRSAAMKILRAGADLGRNFGTDPGAPGPFARRSILFRISNHPEKNIHLRATANTKPSRAPRARVARRSPAAAPGLPLAGPRLSHESGYGRGAGSMNMMRRPAGRAPAAHVSPELGYDSVGWKNIPAGTPRPAPHGTLAAQSVRCFRQASLEVPSVRIVMSSFTRTLVSCFDSCPPEVLGRLLRALKVENHERYRRHCSDPSRKISSG